MNLEELSLLNIDTDIGIGVLGGKKWNKPTCSEFFSFSPSMRHEEMREREKSKMASLISVAGNNVFLLF